jgi:hypothetical protein
MDPYTTPGAFSWNELMTSDPEAALAFYPPLFGWTVETMPMPDGPYHVVKAAGTAVGGVMKLPESAAADGMPSCWGSYVTVIDVDATCEKAKSLGGHVVHGPADVPGVGRFAVIVDPQGAAINVMAYARRDG